MNKLMQAYTSLDEEILRYYTKLGMKIPEKTLYKTTRAASYIGGVIGGTSLLFTNHIAFLPFMGGGTFFAGINLSLSDLGLEGELEEETNGETKSMNPVVNFAQNVVRNTRLPVLAGSIALGAISYNLFNQETPDLEKAILLGVAGVSYFTLASAMYLNDRKPKLLQRDSLLTQVYHKVKNALTLPPERVPVPVRKYSTLESAL
nr:hypothetical protein [Nanoarchaeum sp.]